MDIMRDNIITANGVSVIVDTRLVPFPFGRGWETVVLRENRRRPDVPVKRGTLDVIQYRDEDEARIGHAEMIKKWIRGVA